jgi:flagellar basal-body rod modification protein FlgD
VANPSSTLDQSDFLQMLITKLENQDPLNVDDSSFTGDLAQYSSLASQQSSNTTLSAISTKLDDLNTNITSQTLLTNTAQAVSLTGKTVVINTTDSSGNSTGTVTGTVDVVKFVNGVPKLVVNGVEYDLSTVSEVS